MSYYAILLAPLVVLLPAAAVVDPKPEVAGESAAIGSETPSGEARPLERLAQPAEQPGSPLSDAAPFRRVAERFRAREANQVRIEQRVTIRVSPRPQPVQPNMLMSLPGREIGPRFAERKMGKCLKASGIAGVQPNGGNRLLLFMRDQRIVSAELERACRSRDFYSGFYLSRSRDGQLCIDRDTLLSRSGANCKLTRIRQLVETDD